MRRNEAAGRFSRGSGLSRVILGWVAWLMTGHMDGGSAMVWVSFERQCSQGQAKQHCRYRLKAGKVSRKMCLTTRGWGECSPVNSQTSLMCKPACLHEQVPWPPLHGGLSAPDRLQIRQALVTGALARRQLPPRQRIDAVSSQGTASKSGTASKGFYIVDGGLSGHASLM